MSTSPFESVRRRAIAAGLTPRYARRLTMELDDHFRDLRTGLVDDGFDPVEADRIARERMGSDDIIVERVLATGRYRSLARWRPIVFFVIVPPAAMVSVMALIAAIVAVVGRTFAAMSIESTKLMTSFLSTWGVPLTAASLVGIWFIHGYRRHCALWWPGVACAVLALLSATLVLQVDLPHGDSRGTVHIGLGLPIQPWVMLAPVLIFGSLWFLTHWRERRIVAAG